MTCAVSLEFRESSARIFDMEHISVLSIIGIVTGLDEVEEKQAVAQASSPQTSQDNVISMCIICLDNVRNVALKPCSLVAVCDGCALILQESGEPMCPICRGSIIDIEKVFLA